MESGLIPAREMKNLFPGTTDQSWASRRYKGNGPRFVKLGKSVYYRREDIDAWIDSNLHERTDRKVSI